MSWWAEFADRLAPAPGSGVSGPTLAACLLLGILAASLPPVWRVLRVGVTLVHELGHALVGVVVGRRFTGFVVRGDMSGHAVTSGRPRGLGRVLTTWAGYPAPALTGLLMIWCGVRGWAAALLGLTLVTLLGTLLFVRSGFTLVVVAVAGAAFGALWWWRVDSVQSALVVGAGLVLLVGAWRHLLAVVPDAAERRARGALASDPAILASLTGVPRILWLVSYAAAIGWCTWVAGRLVLAEL